MKEVAILLLVALMLNGCGSSSAPAQVSAAATWQAALSGGEGPASGMSFNTQFTLNSDGSLNISSFQFLTNQNTSCFAVSGESPTGTISNLIVNTSTNQVTGNFSYTVQGNGSTLTLAGTLVGTETGTQVGTNNTGTFTSATVTGTWSFVGGGTPTGCNSSVGSFTMTLNPTA